jgi:uncharacterized protein
MDIKKQIIDLLKSNNTPHEIAFGVAIGVFIGVMPVYGLHFFLVLLFAFILPDINKIAMLAGSNISIPPAIPLISWVSYNIGRLILGNACPVLAWASLKRLKYNDIPEMYYPLFLGSIILGIVCAVMFYFITLFCIEKRRNGRNCSYN